MAWEFLYWCSVSETEPATPPIDVMLIILAVVTAAATLQVAGGLNYMVRVAERLLRAHPKRVTLLAPLCCFFLTVCVGTGHAVYALLPVIADVAWRTRIRPERPMAISSVAAQMGITASPVSAAVGFFLAFAAKPSHPLQPDRHPEDNHARRFNRPAGRRALEHESR